MIFTLEIIRRTLAVVLALAVVGGATWITRLTYAQPEKKPKTAAVSSGQGKLPKPPVSESEPEIKPEPVPMPEPEPEVKPEPIPTPEPEVKPEPVPTPEPEEKPNPIAGGIPEHLLPSTVRASGAGVAVPLVDPGNIYMRDALLATCLFLTSVTVSSSEYYKWLERQEQEQEHHEDAQEDSSPGSQEQEMEDELTHMQFAYQ